MHKELTTQDHIITLLDEGYTPEQVALKLCERLNNYTPFKQFRKQATDLAIAMESYPHGRAMSGEKALRLHDRQDDIRKKIGSSYKKPIDWK